jgi:tetratricopeptide (TPR) repeat protein
VRPTTPPSPLLAPLALLAAALILLAPAPAGARHPRALTDGINAYNQVEYGPALMYLKAALQQSRRSDDLATAYFYLGCTYLAMDRRDQAREAFETLLAFRPTYVPDRRLTSPKIARFFAKVRGGYETPLGPPSMSHRPPQQARPRLTRLRLGVVNLSPRLRPVLRYRDSASPSYFSAEARALDDDGATFALPAPAEGGLVLYYFALMDRSGVTVQRLGSARRPYRLRAAAGDAPDAAPGPAAGVGTPWYKSWWFWTAVGAVAVGTGLGLGFGLSGADEVSSARVTILRKDSTGNSVQIFAP